MAETIASAKRALRKRVLAVRDALPESARAAKSAAICREIAELLPSALSATASRETAAALASRDSVEPDGLRFSPTCNGGASPSREAAAALASRDSVELDEPRFSPIRSEGAMASCDTPAARAPRKSVEPDGLRFSPTCSGGPTAIDNPSESSLTCSTQAPTVALYAPLGSEVDIAPLAELAYERGLRVALPCMLTPKDAAATGQRMCMRAVDAKHIATAPFAVRPLEPLALDDARVNARWPIVGPNTIDFIVVPLVGFDARGARLGYGGGCYDRYLPLLKNDCIIVGAAFEEQRVDAVPCDEHDTLLERIVCA